jgi:hypothetical protein
MMSEKSQGWPERRIDSAFCETRSLRMGFDSGFVIKREDTILAGYERSLTWS